MDFKIGSDGDLADTSTDPLKSFRNEIRTIVKADVEDWENYPEIGASLLDFKGEPNTRETAERIKQRLFSKLTANNVVKAADLAIKIVPIHTNQILIVLRISVTATPANQLKSGNPVVVSFVYDSMEHDIFFLPDKKLESNYFFK